MSPTIFIYRGYRFFFFSREETRKHVHVYHAEGEAKFWIEPSVALATSFGLTQKQLRELEKIIEERKHEIEQHWDRHFGS